MKKVLVTGGRGGLGSALAPLLVRAGWQVRVMTHRSIPTSAPDGIEYARADLGNGSGLREAVEGAHIIVHSATNAIRRTREVDVEGTARLLDAARGAGVEHILYPSIVGIDTVPYPYYQHKVAVEKLVRESGIPWTIARYTQFYSLLELWMGLLSRSPLLVLPLDFLLQPMHHEEAAADLLEKVGQPPAGMARNMGGPRRYELGELVKSWLAVRSKRRLVINLPLRSRTFDSIRAGVLTCPDGLRGSRTWEEWLGTEPRHEPLVMAKGARS